MGKHLRKMAMVFILPECQQGHLVEIFIDEDSLALSTGQYGNRHAFEVDGEHI